MDQMVDNAAEMRVGWSFVDDGRNREAFGGVDGSVVGPKDKREKTVRRRRRRRKG
ncbi:hypothetical protein NA57DRAFT_81650 [Rhizodiscina lignyota]|uniref:Uncharacterized protein n=1 Tax=Rhizodiscina lignyota TaxID=1504668 RepID=A0A9P4I5B2_9PEZI|nr:hypothetical protein NA57DRAFT_81650 [Rhizodiscina lignyota]